jgi:hypothetical protein
MAIKSNILYYTDEDGANVSFTNRFIEFLTGSSKARSTINVDNLKSLGNLAFMEYLTTTEVANFLGLTHEEFFDLPIKDPNKLKAMFDLGEVVHRLINSDFYERVALVQEEQKKERAEWRKRVLRK